MIAESEFDPDTGALGLKAGAVEWAEVVRVCCLFLLCSNLSLFSFVYESCPLE